MPGASSLASVLLRVHVLVQDRQRLGHEAEALVNLLLVDDERRVREDAVAPPGVDQAARR